MCFCSSKAVSIIVSAIESETGKSGRARNSNVQEQSYRLSFYNIWLQI